MLSRNLETKITHLLELFPAVVLIGSRQCGKTTLAKMVRPDWNYFDLEKGTDLDFVSNDFDFFFKQHPYDLIIDEAQASPELFQELRGAIDSDRPRKGRFLLTGSSSPELTKRISESLAGRIAILEVGTLKLNERTGHPLSRFYSILDRQPISSHLDGLLGLTPLHGLHDVMNHFLKGGYPEPIVMDSDAFQAEWMDNFHKTYLERDIRMLFPGLNTENYRRFISMLSELSGTIINRSEIGRSLNTNESAIRDYLDIAQGTFVWRSLHSLENSRSKSIVKMPRGYLRDSGLAHHLLNIRKVEQLYTRPGTGSAFEGFVIEEIIRGFQAVETAPWNYRFYRTRGGAEVDLVLTTPEGGRIPVEIKFGISTRRADLRSLSRFIEQEGCEYGILINNADEVRILAENIIQIPAGCL